MTASAILAHCDALLDGSYVAITHAMAEPLVRVQDAAELDRTWTPRADRAERVHYFREVGDDPGTPVDFIGSGSTLRQFTISLSLIVYCSERLGIVESSRRGAQTDRLIDTWQAVRSVIEWPGNLEPQRTGWRNSTQFRCGTPRLAKDKLRVECSFRVHYLHTY